MVTVGRVEDFPDGSQRRVVAAGRAIAIFNVEGRLRALKSTCPHQGGDLAEGVVVGAVSADQPGDYRYDATSLFVKCPWHGWEFDLATGQSWCDPVKQRVRSYPVSVQSGGQLVAQEEPARQAGPYVAETIPITVEGDYVVVEL